MSGVCDYCGCPEDVSRAHGCHVCEPDCCADCNRPMGPIHQLQRSRYVGGCCVVCEPDERHEGKER